MQLGRFPFYLVDTIGVKFADEYEPSDEEMRREFSLVRVCVYVCVCVFTPQLE
jgi:hypothetical protein